MQKITQKSYAKINLFLKVTSKHENGFHHLESVLAAIDLHDILDVEIAKNFSLTINGKFGHALDARNNLLTKILDYFVENFSVSRNLKIILTKNIPIGAGIGGGSSNAAYFMLALNKLFNLNLDKKTLQKISLNFGSDIAFFFEDKASIIKGRGDIIENYKNHFDDLEILLINPNIHLSTKDVFNKFENIFDKEIDNKTLQEKNIFELLELPNSLTKPAISMVYEISKILSELTKYNPLCAKMSGNSLVRRKSWRLWQRFRLIPEIKASGA